jgi:hypothetical protein
MLGTGSVVIAAVTLALGIGLLVAGTLGIGIGLVETAGGAVLAWGELVAACPVRLAAGAELALVVALGSPWKSACGALQLAATVSVRSARRQEGERRARRSIAAA